MQTAGLREASAAPESGYAVQNLVLSTLSEADFELLRPALRPHPLKKNSILQDVGKPADAVYFIESGCVSRVARTRSDGPVEVALVGKYGFVGVSIVLGTLQPLQRTIVHVPGAALKIDAADLAALMAQSPTLRQHLLRYVQVLMSTKAQIALCNAKHDINQRTARWLLLARDALDSSAVPVTHNVIAASLGVRRPGVSKALGEFEAKRIIERSRGTLRILNLAALEHIACECREIVHERFALLRDRPRHDHII